jgi:hypothetical protein
MTTGIQFEKDTSGRNVFVRIDLKKYGKQIAPFLEEIGVSIDTKEFENDRQRGLTPEEFKKEMHKRIDAWQEK